MSTPYEILIKYHFHTTRRLMDLAAQLDEAALQENLGYGHGSIHGLLLHLLNTDRSWRTGLETGQQPDPLSADDFPGLAELQSGFAGEQQAWEDLLAGLAPEEIESPISLVSRGGDEVSVPRWLVMQHVLLHGMQHHAELAQLLTTRGQTPGDLDFMFYRGE